MPYFEITSVILVKAKNDKQVIKFVDRMEKRTKPGKVRVCDHALGVSPLRVDGRCLDCGGPVVRHVCRKCGNAYPTCSGCGTYLSNYEQETGACVSCQERSGC